MEKRFVFTIIALGFFAFDSFAYDWESNPGDGSSQNPYQISEPNQLIAIGSNASLLNQCFILTNSIIFDPNNNPDHVFAQAVIAPDLSFWEDGFQGTPFSGTFDGENHTIYNLRIESTESGEYIGLFGNTKRKDVTTAIMNLHLKNVLINTSKSELVGGLIGKNGFYGYPDDSVLVPPIIPLPTEMPGATIINCNVSGTIVGNARVGGLIGYNYRGKIHRCSSNSYISGVYNIGGLVGHNYYYEYEAISESCAFGKVEGGSNLGGLIGYHNSGKVFSCYAACQIIAKEDSSKVGGLIGSEYVSELSNCYATCQIIAQGTSSDMGGFIGFLWKGNVSNCYAGGHITAAYGPYHGGLVGRVDIGSTHSSYFLDTTGPDNGYGTPLDDTNMMIQVNFSDWDFVGEDTNGFNDIWWMCIDGIHYPKLSWEYGQKGDFACPGSVGMEDLTSLANHWLTSETGNPDFNYACDGSGDGRINKEDFSILSNHWLQ